MERQRQTRTHKWFNSLLKQTFGRLIRWRYHIRTENLEEIEKIPSPWLVLPNHVMTWDPVMISLFVKDPIYFIASDANFRNRLVSWWLRQVGAIPTSKQATDFSTLKQILEYIREGKTVGLFPEGERTWDGVTIDIIPATAKLARLAGVPVVVPVIKGGFLSLPRWSYKSRRGPVTIEYKLAISGDEIRGMKTAEIQDRIRRAIHHDEAEFQRRQQKPYLSKAPAEPLQLSLFTCPECRSLNSMEGRGSIFGCRECGWSAGFGSYGYFRRVNGQKLPFSSIREWSVWQTGELERQISEKLRNGDESELFSDSPTRYSTGFKFNSLHRKGSGRLSLNIRGIRFNTPRKELNFPWTEVRALNVVYQAQLEFYYRGRLQVFKFPEKNTSGYKYLAAGRIIQSDNGTV